MHRALIVADIPEEPASIAFRIQFEATVFVFLDMLAIAYITTLRR
jgi:hypothetical protein